MHDTTLTTAQVMDLQNALEECLKDCLAEIPQGSVFFRRKAHANALRQNHRQLLCYLKDSPLHAVPLRRRVWEAKTAHWSAPWIVRIYWDKALTIVQRHTDEVLLQAHQADTPEPTLRESV